MEPQDKRQRSPSFEDYPLTRSEYITAMVHFYRGELSRATAWRTRLDTTTNWAVVTTGAMLSFAFSQPHLSAHVSLLLADLLVANFLVMEARRFRYFDVWRSRIRMLEENFYIPIVRRNLVSPRDDWREFVAEDLDHPTFKFTFLQAVGTRLRRTYGLLFLAILGAWILKLQMHPSPAEDAGVIIERMAVGALPGEAVLALVMLFYAAGAVVAVRGRTKTGRSDEVEGLERAMDHWKT